MNANTPITNLPFEGEYLCSPSKKHSDIVVFIHHFGGNKKSTRRHQKILLEAGYDCVTFNLYYHSFDADSQFSHRLMKLIRHVVTGHKNFIETWTDQLNSVLDHLPGEKILFSLSSPSTSAVGVLGGKQRKDVKAWICDSGPFLDAWECFWNYNAVLARISNPLLLAAINTTSFIIFGGLGYERRLRRWISETPKDFPVLSLRCEKDQLVPLRAIEKFFALPHSFRLSTHLFNGAEHLGGIKTHFSDYRQILIEFLQDFRQTGS